MNADYLAKHNLIEITPRLGMWLVQDKTWGMVNLLHAPIQPFAYAISHAIQHETMGQNRCEQCCLPHEKIDVHDRLGLWGCLIQSCKTGLGQYAFPRPHGAMRFDKRTDKLIHPTGWHAWSALINLCMYHFAKYDSPDMMSKFAVETLESAATAWNWYHNDNGWYMKDRSYGRNVFLDVFGKMDTPSQLPMFTEVSA